jgi:hypothetical protein
MTATKPQEVVIIDDMRTKGKIYDRIESMIQQKCGGRRVGRDFAKSLFEAQIDLIFGFAIHTGLFRFPKGLGTLHLKQLAPTNKKLPNGEFRSYGGNRPILRYHEGLSIRAALGKPDKYPSRKRPIRKSLIEPPW